MFNSRSFDRYRISQKSRLADKSGLCTVIQAGLCKRRSHACLRGFAKPASWCAFPGLRELASDALDPGQWTAWVVILGSSIDGALFVLRPMFRLVAFVLTTL